MANLEELTDCKATVGELVTCMKVVCYLGDAGSLVVKLHQITVVVDLCIWVHLQLYKADVTIWTDGKFGAHTLCIQLSRQFFPSTLQNICFVHETEINAVLIPRKL